MNNLLVLMELLVLHSPDGREIVVNPRVITSMYAPAQQVHKDIHCVINLSDGKFVSVVEQCSVIEQTIEKMPKRPGE